VPFDPVARTAWLTARLRAEETARPSPLVHDPFAARLVDAAGAPTDEPEDGPPAPSVASLAEFVALMQSDPKTASKVVRAAALAVRSRYFEDAILAGVAEGARTVVLLAAGLDTRVYRLPLPSDLRWVEVDREDTLAFKRRVLADATPHAELVSIGGDLRDPAVLASVTRSLRAPSVWILEGLLMYLQPHEVAALLDTVAAQLTPGSRVVFDVPNLTYLDPHGPVAAHIAMNAARGSPWTFATDDPAPLVVSRGLAADVVHIGHPRAHYGRLPWPAAEMPAPGQPTSFLVTGRGG
jgi:methyltransferase (TIGR00027 family)